MIVLGIVMMIILVFFATMYVSWRFVFCNPKKRRPDVHRIPETDLYKDYIDCMTEIVKDMEETPFEEIRILSRDNYSLYGKFYPVKKDAPLMIFFHGYHGVSAWDGHGFYKVCKKNGINILMVDERAHGNSEGKAITLGIRERYDCRSWVDYAVTRFGENTDIILAGVSMGATSIIMSAELGFPENVKVILADCGFSEPAAIIRETVRNMHLPVTPVYGLIKMGARLFGHLDIEEMTAVKALECIRIPILFLHGKEDSVVPVSMNDELYEKCVAPKERVLVEGADHANSAMTDFDAYEKAVMNFLNEHLFS